MLVTERQKSKLRAQNELPDESIYQLFDSLATNSKDVIVLNSVVLSDVTATLSSHPVANAK